MGAAAIALRKSGLLKRDAVELTFAVALSIAKPLWNVNNDFLKAKRSPVPSNGEAHAGAVKPSRTYANSGVKWSVGLVGMPAAATVILLIGYCIEPVLATTASTFC